MGIVNCVRVSLLYSMACSAIVVLFLVAGAFAAQPASVSCSSKAQCLEIDMADGFESDFWKYQGYKYNLTQHPECAYEKCPTATYPTLESKKPVKGFKGTFMLKYGKPPTMVNATATFQTCDEGDNCYDLRMQNVPGCTQGWTLHGLWPQWAESCSSEQFDPSQVASIVDDLNANWPSCSGSAQSFWSHEWGKHGTCSRRSEASAAATIKAVTCALPRTCLLRWTATLG